MLVAGATNFNKVLTTTKYDNQSNWFNLIHQVPREEKHMNCIGAYVKQMVVKKKMFRKQAARYADSNDTSLMREGTSEIVSNKFNCPI